MRWARHRATSTSLLVAVAAAASAGPAERAANEMAAHEAVLRYQFQHNESAQRMQTTVFCISVAQRDPSDELVRRLATSIAPVKKASACRIDDQGVFDKATGARGLQLLVDAVTWVADDEATVRGGYYEAPLSASTNVYRLKKKDNAWVVTMDRLLTIS